ncbi:putative peptidase S10, serine carboxypeptidase, alpha/beta hydrolase fold protein [Tanacetum coccineum]
MIYNGKKAALKERHWVPDEDGTYDVERIRRGRPLHISEVDWDAQIAFWNYPKNLSRAALNKKTKKSARSYDELKLLEIELQGLALTLHGVPALKDEDQTIVFAGQDSEGTFHGCPLSFSTENCWKNNITLELNPYSWTKMANMIFVDTPAGVGFSYAKTWEASRSSDTILASNVYDFLRKGYIMISPLTDKFADFNSRLELAHRLSLISDDIYKSAIASCHGNYLYADDNNALYSNNLQQMEQCIGDISLSNTLEPFCALVNPDPTCPEATQIFSEVWANNKDVQKALNIREVKS